jgi:hypothetical protein
MLVLLFFMTQIFISTPFHHDGYFRLRHPASGSPAGWPRTSSHGLLRIVNTYSPHPASAPARRAGRPPNVSPSYFVPIVRDMFIMSRMIPILVGPVTMICRFPLTIYTAIKIQNLLPSPDHQIPTSFSASSIVACPLLHSKTLNPCQSCGVSKLGRMQFRNSQPRGAGLRVNS